MSAILVSGIGFAQTTVSGTVVDSEIGTGLPGATIVVKGTSDGVSGDFNGFVFQLQLILMLHLLFHMLDMNLKK